MNLDFIQIIYEESQREHCYPFARIHKNEECTPFFENSVIADLVPNSKGDYIGVCSYRLREKRNKTFGASEGITYQRISEARFDLGVLTPRTHKDIIVKLMNWHPRASVEAALKEFRKFIKFPDEVDHAIYENHFIARVDIYKEYVETCLKPAMEFMKDKPVFFADAGYITRKRDKDLEHAQKLLASWGRTDYPLAPFILERLFSVWIQGKGFKVINL